MTDLIEADVSFGIAPASAAKLVAVLESVPGLRAAWIYGSRARGDARPDSDIDLLLDYPDASSEEWASVANRIRELDVIYKIDVARWQDSLDEGFRRRIARDRKLLWAPQRQPVDVESIGATTLKPFQTRVLQAVDRYVDELIRQQASLAGKAEALRVLADDQPALVREASDFPKRTWEKLRTTGHLPPAYAGNDYSSRFDGAGNAVPNLCLKVPTGGGKTLLAAASVARVFSAYLKRRTGLVLWVVPNEAIYRQTLKALSDRDHPYRQILNVAGAGRVKILEKTSPLTRLDTDSHLCVMVLMLASAARQSKETLRFFRDRGNVLGFLPREDDINGHWDLLQQVPNLDVYSPTGIAREEAHRQKGSIVKSSLGNVMRMLRPMVVMDEGHHAYTENALRTLDGFNPCFLLELSATPRVASVKGSGSNILVDVRGSDLDDAQMIKLPIHVEARRWQDWRSCLAASVAQLDLLQQHAERLQAETARYIRPILLVQVERTGSDQRDAGFIHADDAQAYLLQLGFQPRQIAIKTSEKDELKQPENLNLTSPQNEVRAIITKQALQEGWDCPFAYVLCALSAGRNAAAMTQLVGRILRQPDTIKTEDAALDACYVFCHDVETGEVVKRIKDSLEGEGMGDLTLSVRGDGDKAASPDTLTLKRRPQFARLRLFLPKVTWVEDGQRRELVYDSDILAGIDWHAVDASVLARHWAPGSNGALNEHVMVDLDVLRTGRARHEMMDAALPQRLDRARLVRGLLDLAPNAWLVWRWVDAVVSRLLAQGYSEDDIARTSASLTERLRVDIEQVRDLLAQQHFDALAAQGRIEFRLRADATDYVLPGEFEVDVSSRPAHLQRPDARAVDKSLLEPALRLPDMNDFEARFAGYLDSRQALHWWHRNVAKKQYGLQGWKRNKVYPDFVFGQHIEGDRSRVVLLETKGEHLAGASDTAYKQSLLARLTEIFADERTFRAGELELQVEQDTVVVCDLLFDQAWEGTLESRYFADSN
jgi:type III restriction enzyme